MKNCGSQFHPNIADLKQRDRAAVWSGSFRCAGPLFHEFQAEWLKKVLYASTWGILAINSIFFPWLATDHSKWPFSKWKGGLWVYVSNHNYGSHSALHRPFFPVDWRLTPSLTSLKCAEDFFNAFCGQMSLKLNETKVDPLKQLQKSIFFTFTMYMYWCTCIRVPVTYI